MATLYMAPGGGNWNGANWATTSGGTATTTPTAADDCILDANSGNVTVNSGSVCRSWTVNGYTGTVTHTAAVNIAIGDATAGAGNKALDFATTGWTYTLGNATTSSFTFVSTSGTQQTVNFNGKTPGNVTFQGIGGSFILGSALNAPSITLVITQCAFDSSNYNIDVGTWNSSGASVRSITLGTSTVTVWAASGTPFTQNTTTNLTFSGANATFVIASVGTSDRTFAGGGLTYGTLTYDVANSPGRLIVTGANTFTTTNFGSGRPIRLPASTTNTTSNFNATGVNNTASNGFVYSGGGYAASIPDSAATSIAGDMDIRLRVAIDDWAQTGAQRLCAKYGTATNRSWRLYHIAGVLTFDLSTDGTNSSAGTASVNVSTIPLNSGTTYWIRVTREKSTGNIKFYYAADSTTMPSSWTQIGTTRTASTSDIYDSATINTIGGESTGTNSATGKYYWYQVRNNILDDGTGIQIDAKFADKTWGSDSWTESSSNAATVTLNAGAVYGDGRIYVESSSAGSAATLSKSSGTVSCDYLVLKDSAASGGASWYAGANSISVSGNSGWVFTAPPSTSPAAFFALF